MARNESRRPAARKAPGGSQSIRRAFDVMRFVASGRENGRRLTEVAESLGLNITTAHRLLATLVYSGLLVQRAESKVYYLGPELVSLAAIADAQFALRNLLDPVLSRIAQDTGDTVFLQVRAGDETVCLARTRGSYPVAALALDVGTRLPLGLGSAGLAMLAFMEEEEREGILARCAEAYRKHGLTPGKVRNAVLASRREGFGFQTGQVTEEISSVAVLLLGKDEIAAAISVTALTQRMSPARMRQIVGKIRSACSGLARLRVFPSSLPLRAA